MTQLSLWSQGGHRKYYMEITSSQYVPTVKVNSDATVSLTFGSTELTRLFSSYTVYSFELAFPGAKRPLLTRVYIIDCGSNLISELNQEYSSIFNGIVEVPVVEPLFLPNDIGFSGGQPELDFIGAPQAWDITHGNSSVLLGINDLGVNPTQEDLIGKSVVVDGSALSGTASSHGTLVASPCAANTNNGIGMAAIGFDCHIRSTSLGYGGLMPLVNSGVRAINMSWGSCSTNPVNFEYELLNEIWEDHGVVLIAAAGNGSFSCPAGPQYDHFPASFNHVISVTNVGHQYDIGTPGVDENFWKDVFLRTTPPLYATHNPNVDLSAPGRNILTISLNNSTTYSYSGGTSVSAPIVTGTVGLMFSVNSCLFPDEVESILKLTAVRNDNLPQNALYQGRIGAGRLDAYKAVDMAKDMADAFGTVEVTDRFIDRWDFVLKTAPYKINLTNNVVTNNATLDFSARNNIEIISGDYAPTTGFVDLEIDSDYAFCNTPLSGKFEGSKAAIIPEMEVRLHPNPNNGVFTISLDKDLKNINVNVFDTFGKLIYTTNENGTSFELNIPNLPTGLYLVKLNSNELNQTLKFIKQ